MRSGDLTAGGIFAAARRDGRLGIIAGSALVVVHQLAELTVPVLIGVIIDRAVTTGDGGAMARWGLALAALFVVLSAAGCTGLWVEERATLRAAHLARTRVARRVLDPGGGVEAALPGQVVSLSTIETFRLGEAVGALIIGAGALAGTLGGAAVLLATSWRLGLVVMLGLPAVLLATQALSQPLVAKADAHQEAVGSAAGKAADLVSGLRVLKGLGAGPAAADGYRRASRHALAAALDANRVRSAYTGITLAVAGGFLVVVAAIGGTQALDDTISIGELVAALGITQFLLGPLGRLALCAEVLAQGRASAARLDEALGAPPAVTGGAGRLQPAGARALTLSGLHHETLSQLSFSVEPGQLVGVVTTDPADAAALVACLDRSADADAGVLAVDGVPVGQLDLDDVRRHVVVGHHDAPLFEGDVLANVGAAAPEGADLAAAIAAAGAEAVLAERAGGSLGEAGRTLSGGQRQRLALARVLATEAPVLVLHEPTTAVDAATEHRIAAGLARLRTGRTTVVVTSSPVLLSATDRVVVVHEGRVVAEGHHTDLARTDERYRATVLA